MSNVNCNCIQANSGFEVYKIPVCQNRMISHTINLFAVFFVLMVTSKMLNIIFFIHKFRHTCNVTCKNYPSAHIAGFTGRSRSSIVSTFRCYATPCCLRSALPVSMLSIAVSMWEVRHLPGHSLPRGVTIINR